MNFDKETTCGCQGGWLSPRTKFVLNVTAACAVDDCNQEPASISSLAPLSFFQALPKSLRVASWFEGLAVILGIISSKFEAGKIPDVDEVERAMALLTDSEKKANLAAYQKSFKSGAGAGEALEALVKGAKYQWEDEDFEEMYSDQERWNALPKCAEHDFDWDLAEDELTG
ncbi:hypothetical protein DFH06DRAFT_220300 [Mycena polygramma]|nr:hypothetical protein DFH06DRAFT_220300 [Mycena polygramma]